MTDSISINTIQRMTGGDAFFIRDLDESIDDIEDLQQIRNIGQVNPLTRQPLKGKVNEGKLRLGEL